MYVARCPPSPVTPRRFEHRKAEGRDFGQVSFYIPHKGIVSRVQRMHDATKTAVHGQA